MTLREKQSKFAKMIALLILYTYQKGYELTFGDAWATSGHVDRSKHYDRLAFDLNLFYDGIYLKETSDYAFLGKFWEDIGGTWGGRRGDGCHFEF
jgi:hypothetical protein